MGAAPWLPPYCGADDLLSASCRAVQWRSKRAACARSDLLFYAAKHLHPSVVTQVVASMLSNQEAWLLRLGEAHVRERGAKGARRPGGIAAAAGYSSRSGGTPSHFHVDCRELHHDDMMRQLFGPLSAWGDGDLAAVAAAATALAGHHALGPPIPIAPYAGDKLRRSLLERRRVRHRRAPWPAVLSDGPQWG